MIDMIKLAEDICVKPYKLMKKEANKQTDNEVRYLGYIAILRENEGVIVCSDCGEELLMSDLIENYDEPLCLNCIRNLKK